MSQGRIIHRLSSVTPVSGLLLIALSGVPAFAEGDGGLLAEGRRLAESGRFQQALRTYDRFKRQHPDDFRPYLYSAQAMLAAGRDKDAALELDDAMVRRPGTVQQVIAYARARESLGHLREAVRILADARTAETLPAEGLWLLADLYYRLKEARNAKRVLDEFARQRPDDPRLKLRRGQVYIYLEEFEKALTELEEWVWDNPESAEGHFEMARTLRYGNNPEAAKKAALKAVQLEPDNVEYLHMLGIICDSLKQPEEAVRYLERAAASPGAFTRIYFDLGNALRRAGKSDRAREALQKYRDLYTVEEARANDSKKVEALINQGHLQARQGAVLEALSSFQRVLEVDPDNWAAHAFLAKIYLSSQKEALAKPHLDRMEQIDPDTSEGAFLSAFYWHERRDYARALEYAERSKRLRPGDAELRNLLGNIHFGAGDFEAAAEEYAAASALAPERFDFKANLRAARRRLEGLN